MNYSDILSALGLVISEYKEDEKLSEIFDDSFLEEFEKMYSDLSNKINELDDQTLAYITSNTNAIVSYTNKINEIKEISDKQIENCENINKMNIRLANDNINISSKKYEKLNKSIEKSVTKRNKIVNNEILSNEIKTNELNDVLKSKNLPNLNCYNELIRLFNDSEEMKYKKLHSSLSKQQYDLLDSVKSYQKSLLEKNQNVLNKIASYKQSLVDEEAKMKAEIIELETDLNKKIFEIQGFYKTIMSQNQEQYRIQIEDLDTKLNEIDKEYTNIIKNINYTASKKLIEIDNKYLKDERKLKQIIQDDKYKNHVSISLDLDSINALKKQLKNKNIRHTEKRYIRTRLRVENRKFLKDKNVRELGITINKRKLESITNKIMKEKKDVEAWRQYNINIKLSDKETKRHPFEVSKAILEKEKELFDKNERNKQDKEINDQKRNTQIAIDKKKRELDSFSAKIEIEIHKLEIDSFNILKNKDVSEKIENEILQYNQKYDDLSDKYFSNMALYNIEKNKYLKLYNDTLIETETQRNLLNNDFFKVNKTREFNRFKTISENTINFNNKSNSIYKTIQNNFIKNSEIHCKNNIYNIEVKKNYYIAKEKFVLQSTRKAKDISILNKHFKFLDYTIKRTVKLFVGQLNKAINLYHNSSDNYISYYSSVLELASKLIEEFLNNENKILNNYIKFDTGNKYASVYASIEYEYNQKLNNYKAQIMQFENTNKNYKAVMSVFYKEIQNLTFEINKLSGQNDTKKIINQKKKEKLSIEEKNNFNREKMDLLNKEIEKINKKIELLNKHKEKRIERAKVSEIKESEDSLSTIENLNDVCAYYINILSESITDEFIAYLLSFSKKNKKFNKFYKLLTKNSSSLILELSKILNNYDKNLEDSLSLIKQSYTLSYIKNKRVNNSILLKSLLTNKKEFNHVHNQFIDNIKDHEYENTKTNKTFDSIKKDDLQNHRQNMLDLKEKIDMYHDKYFLRFSSCDKLIRYCINNYQNSLKQNKRLQNESISNHNNYSKELCDKNARKHYIEIDRYKNEINLIPKLTSEKIATLNEEINDKNKSLDQKTKENMADFEKFKQDFKVKTYKLNMKHEKEKRNQYIIYKKSEKDNIIEYAKKEKGIRKIEYAE